MLSRRSWTGHAPMPDIIRALFAKWTSLSLPMKYLCFRAIFRWKKSFDANTSRILDKVLFQKCWKWTYSLSLFSLSFLLWTARGTALPLKHHRFDVILEGFLSINCRRRTFTWRYPFHKIFTCVPHKLSWGSRIGGAVLLVGIRWVEGRMYKTGIAWNWTVWWRTHGLGWWVRIGMPLRSVCCAPWRFADSGQRGGGIWDAGSYADLVWEIRSPALNRISRKLARKTTSPNFWHGNCKQNVRRSQSWLPCELKKKAHF